MDVTGRLGAHESAPGSFLLGWPGAPSTILPFVPYELPTFLTLAGLPSTLTVRPDIDSLTIADVDRALSLGGAE